MKIILSRKGFDSVNGGTPSPILPDGTLLSMPIPSDDPLSFDQLGYQGISYAEILRKLAPHKTFRLCHLDPDIRSDVVGSRGAEWMPAYGQIGAAQGYLRNCKIGKGDLFLFWGWFQRVTADWTYTGDPMHIIYGYMQIGDTLTNCDPRIAAYPWHPHSAPSRLQDATNALYLPSETLSFHTALPGFGTLDFAERRVLTQPGCSVSIWREIPCLMPENIVGNRKNSAQNGGLCYRGIWQELVLKDNALSTDWAMRMLLA